MKVNVTSHSLPRSAVTGADACMWRVLVRNISEAIKLKCAQLYDGSDEASLIAVEAAFVNEMANIIVTHEQGHNVSQLNGKYIDYYAIGDGVRRYGENILTLIKEFMADWVMQVSFDPRLIWDNCDARST